MSGKSQAMRFDRVPLIFIFSLCLLGCHTPGISEQAQPSQYQGHIKNCVAVESLGPQGLRVPSFFSSVPKGCFSGVSHPSASISDARRSAVSDIVRQILRSMGIRYDHVYVDRVYGNVKSHRRSVDDRLRGVARGVVLGVERNIVKSSWYMDGSGRYVYFILVRYPENLIVEMRRLSRAAKVVAKVVSTSGGGVRLKVSEVHGVSVVISSADITVRKRNRFAKAISFCIWHVPHDSESKYQVAFNPIRVCRGATFVYLSLDKSKKNFSDYLLGARLERVIVLHGHDELGRPVSARAMF